MAVPIPETSVYFNETTRRYIPEGYNPCLRENVKSHLVNLYGEVMLRYFQRDEVTHLLDDGDSKHLWNIGLLQRDYTALYPRKL
jgi:hypothetical protein